MRECAGKPCRVERIDGTIIESFFPFYISAHQPFKEMRAVSHRVTEDLEAEVRFEGEVFEMEDQRNWTDACENRLQYRPGILRSISKGEESCSWSTNRAGFWRAIVSLGFAALTVGLSIAVAGRITVPIRRLAGAMGRIQNGDFSVRVEERGTGELILLARSFNAMGAEIDELMGRIALKERETVRAELLALRSQINPHFLCNILDVMRGMALAGGVTEAVEIACCLASLLRYSTAKDSDYVPVRDELGSLRHYLKIQKHRFGSRFATRIRVEPEVSVSLVPRFMLQPLVENAFVHSVEKSLVRLALRVNIRAEADDLLIEVIAAASTLIS
jgi:sensor histidine kinase YesM